jgi:hypothetical protein
VKKNVIMLQSLMIVVGFENNDASRKHRLSSLLVFACVEIFFCSGFGLCVGPVQNPTW